MAGMAGTKKMFERSLSNTRTDLYRYKDLLLVFLFNSFSEFRLSLAWVLAWVILFCYVVDNQQWFPIELIYPMRPNHCYDTLFLKNFQH